MSDEPGQFPVPSPPMAIVACPTGGYWIVTGEGGVYAFGKAPFLGSLSGIPISAPIMSASATPSGQGLYLLGQDGAVYAWGDATYEGRVSHGG